MGLKFACVLLLTCLVFVKDVQGQTGLTDADKEAILNAHNRLRGQVNPSASNMERMVWSDELAAVAQNYAEECVFAHNPNAGDQQSTFRFVGENLAVGTGPADFPGFVQSWYDEVDDYDLESNTCTPNRQCGHYTQVVWATSRSVGCGAVRCADLQNFFPNSVNFVCNYGPAGNFVGQRPYTAGASCSACPDNLPSCANNLCSLSDGTTTAGEPNITGMTTETENPQSTSRMTTMVQNSNVIVLAIILAVIGTMLFY